MSTENYPSEVDAGLLWLGELGHALSRPMLDGIGITHILTVGDMDRLQGDEARERLMFRIHDHEDEFLGVLFERAFEFIRRVRLARGRVLVHCREGRSRSGGLVLAWLMAERGMPLMEAFRHVREVRPQVMPNAGFWEDLVDLEAQLRRCDRHALLLTLPSYVHASAERKGPASVYCRFLTAALNDASRDVIDSVVSRWDPLEWQLYRDPIKAVLCTCFDKMQPEAREHCAGFFAALASAGRVDRRHVAKAFKALAEDSELLADIELDVPHLRAYVEDLRQALVDHGLMLSIERTTSTPAAEMGGGDPEATPPSLIRAASSGPRLLDDSEREWFYYPDGATFSLLSRWGVREYVCKNRRRFRLSSYVSLEPGDAWDSPEGRLTFEIPRTHEKVDIPITTVAKPLRDVPPRQHRARHKEELSQCSKHWRHYNQEIPPPSSEGWFVQKERLLSLLSAMVAGKPLPPIAVDRRYGPARITNGYHRYYASLILGYREIPVVCERTAPVPQPAAGQKRRNKRQQRQHAAALREEPKPPPRWEPKAKRQERLERERVERERLELQRQKAALAREVLEGSFDKSVRQRGRREATTRLMAARRDPQPGGATYLSKARNRQ